MRAIRSKNTTPEIAVRKLLHRLGYRYQLHKKDLPGSPDIVFNTRKKAIFVNGCFWHQHQDINCRLAKHPKVRLEYWKPKLERVRARDCQAIHDLKEIGWNILVVWECQTKDLERLAQTLSDFVSA